ncbi:AbiJ-NTD4 domain-containing protein [Bacillus sp. ISL-45]|uniref:AbiJ-NTD4 domain-containing protein n=1 Tax=Bacillus sp. ISL-45 TaxID=2819128 RepID=UPI001BE9751F|nr:hypothetical protein [Bacillus sp. ISL-45]MBT2663610.1 hypothetical protein [Bacillus sp. ISL-45]
MQSFSQRMGITQVRTILQTESMDHALRVGIWNVIYVHYIQCLKGGSSEGYMNSSSDAFKTAVRVWTNHLKRPINQMPAKVRSLAEELEEYVFESEWYQVYDLIEFLAKDFRQINLPDKFNTILTSEMSGYRFVGNELVKITGDEEIEEIEQATVNTSATHYAATHIKEALRLLADKQNPDFRNSIKESISAVEAICTAITKVSGNEASTLGAALKVIEKESHIELHPALKQAFDKLYGYTSDDGIRHFLKSDKQVDFEDAKFMLVACSAFVNYLTEKSIKAGLTL